MRAFRGGGGCYSSRVAAGERRPEERKTQGSENHEVLVSKGEGLEDVDESAFTKFNSGCCGAVKVIAPVGFEFN